jgi:hypothetical protein
VNIRSRPHSATAANVHRPLSIAGPPHSRLESGLSSTSSFPFFLPHLTHRSLPSPPPILLPCSLPSCCSAALTFLQSTLIFGLTSSLVYCHSFQYSHPLSSTSSRTPHSFLHLSSPSDDYEYSSAANPFHDLNDFNRFKDFAVALSYSLRTSLVGNKAQSQQTQQSPVDIVTSKLPVQFFPVSM